jgi:hypothetical protein
MSIYVITDPIKERENQYKIGRTSKSRNGILTVYTRYLGNPIVKFYKLVPILSNYKNVESNILTLLKDYRIKNNNGNMSEWVKLPLSDILQIINEVFDELGDDTLESYSSNDSDSNEIEDEIEDDSDVKVIEQPVIIPTPNSLRCNKCEKIFKRQLHLDQHNARKNPCNKELICIRCEKKFTQIGHLNSHINRKYPCDDKRYIKDIELKIKKEELLLERERGRNELAIQKEKTKQAKLNYKSRYL